MLHKGMQSRCGFINLPDIVYNLKARVCLFHKDYTNFDCMHDNSELL